AADPAGGGEDARRHDRGRDHAAARVLYARARADRLRARDRGWPAARDPDGPLPSGRELRPAARKRTDADPLARLGGGVHPVVRPRQHGGDSIVFYASLFPMLLNTWSGVRAVNPLWLRAAGAMGADERALFWKVIVPGASPFIITGMRQA